MSQTLFITGTSSGIGKATALYFAELGWNVAATMRSPEQHTDFVQYPTVKTYPLDVTDTTSMTTAISQAIQDFGHLDVLVNNAGFSVTAISQAIQDFGHLDVLVNNAGFSVFGAFECASESDIQRQLNTNLLGVMNVTRAVLPHFRQRKEGRIISVTSVGGLVAFPLFTLYHASKWAVEGFMESLHWQCQCHPGSPQATALSVVSSIRKQLQRHLKASTASVFRLHQGASLHSKQPTLSWRATPPKAASRTTRRSFSRL